MAIENNTKDVILENYIKRKKKEKEKVLGDFLTREERAKKLKKLYTQAKTKPKPIPFPQSADELMDLSSWLEQLDPGGWASDEDKPMKKAGILEQELANEYWHNQHEKYLEMGGTLDFKEFMRLQLKRSEASRGGIVSLR